MREIKFCGKSLVTGEWLYGSLINNAFFQSNDGSPIPYILDTDKLEYESFEDIAEYIDEFEVLPETVGQYTGLKDGTKWEQLTKEEQNDWLQSGKKPEEWKGREIYEGDIYESEDGRDRGVIVFQNCSFEVKWIPPVTFGLRSLLYYNQNGKVVGNIYENPERKERMKDA